MPRRIDPIPLPDDPPRRRREVTMAQRASADVCILLAGYDAARVTTYDWSWTR